MISNLLTIRQKHVVVSFTAMCAYLVRSRTEFGVLKNMCLIINYDSIKDISIMSTKDTISIN